MTKVEDEFSPTEVFGGDNEDFIDEQEDEESKGEEGIPFNTRTKSISSGKDDFVFERAASSMSEDDLELEASKDLMLEMERKMYESERSNVGN